MTDLSVIIVTHNSASDLPECIGSLFEHQGNIDMRVIVADSGSMDDTASVARGYPVLFLPGENRGFAAANNRALAHPGLPRPRYLLFLNPDTVVLEGTLEQLMALCDARANAGIFSVRQVDQDGRLLTTLHRFPSPRRYWLDALEPRAGSGRGHRLVDEELYQRETEFDWATGAFLLVRGEVLESVGGFDERFFFTSEEVDLCRRAHAAGWHRLYVPSLTILHRAEGYVEPWRAWILADHKVRYARKWFSWPQRLLARAALVALYGRLAISSKRTPQLRRAARYSLRGALGFAPPPGPLGSAAASARVSGVLHGYGRPIASDRGPTTPERQP